MLRGGTAGLALLVGCASPPPLELSFSEVEGAKTLVLGIEGPERLEIHVLDRASEQGTEIISSEQSRRTRFGLHAVWYQETVDELLLNPGHYHHDASGDEIPIRPGTVSRSAQVEDGELGAWQEIRGKLPASLARFRGKGLGNQAPRRCPTFRVRATYSSVRPAEVHCLALVEEGSALAVVDGDLAWIQEDGAELLPRPDALGSSIIRWVEVGPDGRHWLVAGTASEARDLWVGDVFSGEVERLPANPRPHSSFVSAVRSSTTGALLVLYEDLVLDRFEGTAADGTWTRIGKATGGSGWILEEQLPLLELGGGEVLVADRSGIAWAFRDGEVTEERVGYPFGPRARDLGLTALGPVLGVSDLIQVEFWHRRRTAVWESLGKLAVQEMLSMVPLRDGFVFSGDFGYAGAYLDGDFCEPQDAVAPGLSVHAMLWLREDVLLMASELSEGQTTNFAIVDLIW